MEFTLTNPTSRGLFHCALKIEVSVNCGLIIARSAGYEQENFNVFAVFSSMVEFTLTSGSYFFKSAFPHFLRFYLLSDESG